VKLTVIVTGSRDWPDPAVIHEDLWSLLKDPEIDTLVVRWGKHWQGADLAVEQWCQQAEPLAVFLGKDLLPDPVPAEWNRYGGAAGPRRNTEMVQRGADAYLSYRLNGTRSRGTTDCMTKCQKAEIFPLFERERSTLPGVAAPR
jgi:hypothetical protein